MDTALFDADLLRRYDRPGPRYTSYPTAPQFHEGFGAAELAEQARRSHAGAIPRRLSLYLHVPYCFSPCFYCGCNRIISRDRERAEVYRGELEREIALTSALFDANREVVQMHWGGGTPNFLAAQQIGRVIETLASHFTFSSRADRDFSIELDPRYIDADGVAALARLGFTRASLGVQDFDPEVQAAVNRIQSLEETQAVLEACRRHGMRSVNIDLIYGLPRQTEQGFARTLEQVVALRPDRLAVYGYAHLPQLFRPQRQIDAAELPDAEAKLGLLQLAIERLTGAGYEYIGMDHFALPDDDLSQARRRGGLQRNFMGYTTHADTDLIGFGVSAISHIADSFSQNARDLPSWRQAIDAGRLPIWRGMELDADDRIRADLIQRLMCDDRVDLAAFERRHGIEFQRYFAADLMRLQPLQADDLVRVSSNALQITPRGRLLLRAVAMCFDRYLHTGEQVPRYSKVI